MTRVTHVEQYRRHQFIRMLFDEPGLQTLFTFLPIVQQQELHEYYATNYVFSELEFEAHRLGLDIRSPTLSSRAGKYFKVIERAFVEASRMQGFTREQMNRAIAIHNQRPSAPPSMKPPWILRSAGASVPLSGGPLFRLGVSHRDAVG